MSFSFVELCAGIGGMRAGLEAAGWRCRLAVDSNPDAVGIHKAAFGDCLEAELEDLAPESLPPHDWIVAGFPCQPFSSSGHRTGPEHRSGNVFQEIARLAGQTRPVGLLLENVQGLLSNRFGSTFAQILTILTGLGYWVEWMLVDAQHLGIPQSRRRVFLVAGDASRWQLPRKPPAQRSLLKGAEWSTLGLEPYAFSPMFERSQFRLGKRESLRLEEVLAVTTPQIGQPAPRHATPFSAWGSCEGSMIATAVLKNGETIGPSCLLGEICAPQFSRRDEIRSARYWAHSGTTRVYLRKDAVSHSIGTSIGAAPLFALQTNLIPSGEREKLLEYSNWHRVQDGILVFRLSPERALLLFGDHLGELLKSFEESEVPSTRKYVLMGNMVAPKVAMRIAEDLASMAPLTGSEK